MLVLIGILILLPLLGAQLGVDLGFVSHFISSEVLRKSALERVK